MNLLENLVYNSKQSYDGCYFLSINCQNQIDYIKEAIKLGAKKIIIDANVLNAIKNDSEMQNDFGAQSDLFVEIECTRELLSLYAKNKFPMQPKYCFAVTGTNGKTSTVDFVRQFFSLLGYKSASIGTLGVIGETIESDMGYSKLTTPFPVELHKILHRLTEKNITHLAIEVSSHAIHQKRCSNICFDVAAFTNLTHDHIDYHKSTENYFNEKKKLFFEFDTKVKIINNNDPYGRILLKEIKDRNKYSKVMTFGKNPDKNSGKNSDIFILSNDDKTIDVRLFGETFKSIQTYLTGFQLENLSCALGICLFQGENPKNLINLIPKIKLPLGRRDLIHEFISGKKKGAKIYIDFAHTPDALEKILIDIKSETKNRLIVLFGCGGNRDSSKRPMMGEIASKYADFAIVTDDNPRYEDPSKIRSEIIMGILKNKIDKNFDKNFKEFSNRMDAIKYAIKSLMPFDSLVIAGKGHEDGQIVGDKALDYNDYDVLNLLQDIS